jgi:Uma2 family endonuclease
MMSAAVNPSFSIEPLEQRARQRGAVVTAPMDRAAFLALPETNLPLEYIDGEIAVSPSPVDSHQEMVLNTAGYLKMLIPHAAGTLRVAPLDVHIDDQNTVQPDVFWVSADNPRCKLGEDGYWYGAPDLIVEVLSPATARRDRGIKFRLYERAGVREYWLIDADYVEVYRLADGRFERVGVFGEGEAFVTSLVDGLTVLVNPLIRK